jgi:hypothetical protein
VNTNKSHHCCSKYVVLEQPNELKTIRLELLSSFGQPEDFDGPLKTAIGNSKHHRDQLRRVSRQVPANLGSTIFPTF